MAASGLIQLSNDLKNDDELRKQFEEDPLSVLEDASYGLTQEEIDTVLAALDSGWAAPMDSWQPPVGT